MKNILCGVLCSALVFVVLHQATARPTTTVQAAIPIIPSVARFQLVQIHPSTDTEWSGILDTETGCTWLFTQNSSQVSSTENPVQAFYDKGLGDHVFSLVNFDVQDYAPTRLNSDHKVDYTTFIAEAIRVQKACQQARLQALAAAGAAH